MKIVKRKLIRAQKKNWKCSGNLPFTKRLNRSKCLTWHHFPEDNCAADDVGKHSSRLPGDLVMR